MAGKRKLTLVSTLHYVRLVYRSVIFVLLAVSYILYHTKDGEAITALLEKRPVLLVGAWLLVSRDFPAAVRADRALTQRKARLPDMHYGFGPGAVRLTGEGSMDIPYGNFTRLVEDRQYLYLFVSRNSVCMMEKASLKPADLMAFAAFLEEKTGLKWRAEKPFLSMSLYDLRRTLREMREK